jgi:hypothetical protein
MKIFLLPTVVIKEINDHTRTFFDCLSSLGELVGISRTITSGNDGTHQGSAPVGQPSNSLHYQNLAWDHRSHDLTGREKQLALDFMRQTLGAGWDILLEKPGSEQEHFHTEYDPKEG